MRPTLSIPSHFNTGDDIADKLDHLNIVRVLDSISPKNLGRFALELGIPQNKYEEFDYDAKCFSDLKAKVVDFWLKNGKERSWKELQRALYAVDERNAGDQIENDFLSKLWKDPRVCH